MQFSFPTQMAALLVGCGLMCGSAGCSTACGERGLSASRREKPVVIKSADIEWTQRPSGVSVAYLFGDPTKPGPFTLRLRSPPGFRKEPHHHPFNAYVTVLSGGYYRGYGNRFDEENAVRLIPGTFSVNPAGVVHYEWTIEPAELEVHATGPWKSVFVDTDGRPLK